MKHSLLICNNETIGVYAVEFQAVLAAIKRFFSNPRISHYNINVIKRNKIENQIYLTMNGPLITYMDQKHRFSIVTDSFYTANFGLAQELNVDPDGFPLRWDQRNQLEQKLKMIYMYELDFITPNLKRLISENYQNARARVKFNELLESIGAKSDVKVDQKILVHIRFKDGTELNLKIK